MKGRNFVAKRKEGVFFLALAVVSVLITISFFQSAEAELILVDNGDPRAQIIIAEEPPRMVFWAAEELQDYIEKISGARLPVTNQQGDLPLDIYVGRSDHTDAMGISDENLDDGSFHLISDKDRLVLLGRDEDFASAGPYSLQSSPNHPERHRMLEEWDRLTEDLTDGKWACPAGKLGRGSRGDLDIRQGDRYGSLYAVHEFLRRLGVRWYMPGELGEIVPEMDTVSFPEMEVTVRPDYAVRRHHFATYFSSAEEDIRWYFRLGLNHGYDHAQHISHGLRDVLSRPEMGEAHPEYYALRGGVRDTENRHACLTSEGLVQEAANFARAQFDIYDLSTVSVMPEDGFRMCGCDQCAGLDTPERGRKGTHSDYVWDFVNRVAQEIYKTHPDRTVNCFSYGTYTLPPLKIDELHPNVKVGMVHGRGKHFPDRPAAYRARGLDKLPTEVREAWKEITSNKLLINWEHYVFTHRHTIWPVYFPHAIARGLNALKDDFIGEFVETAVGPFEERGHGLHAPGFNHLNIYVTARLYWDAQQDVNELLDEYYRLFYGPASMEMKELIEYSEDNWDEMSEDVGKVDHFFDIFEKARDNTLPDTSYRKRIDSLGDYLKGLREWRREQ